MTDDSTTLIEQLSRADAYPERPREIVLHETHISWVFVTEKYAYKLKKPLRFDFLDYSTVEQRRLACEAELRLNRRLAPAIYLDVLPITCDQRGQRHLGGEGATVDWAVRMRRLSDEDRLDVMIRERRLTDADVARVAAHLSEFYRQAAPLTIDASRYRAAFEAHVRSNLRELSHAERGLPEALVRRVHQAQLRLLALAPALLEQRMAERRIIDGHGDLRPEHIYLLDPPVAIDCIEFNDEFRQIDAADELAFLAMECDLLGAPSIGARLFEACCRATADTPPAPLVSFFKSYRAAVRAKVHALRADQFEGDARRESIAAAQQYLSLADNYRRSDERPLVVAVGGLMGTGKSTLAGALGETLGVEVLSTDAIRRELLGESKQPAKFGEGHYASGARELVYRELFNRADARLAAGLSVVLDGTFLSSSVTERALALAGERDANFYCVRTVCPLEVALRRISARMRSGDSLSEARPELLARQQNEAAATGERCTDLEIDSTSPLSEQVRQVLSTLADRFPIERTA